MIRQELKQLTTIELILLFEAVRDELNLKTITGFSAAKGCVYNTAKKAQPATSVCGTKFIPLRDGK